VLLEAVYHALFMTQGQIHAENSLLVRNFALKQGKKMIEQYNFK
jgi:hypothetical protein